jgi:5'-methylthioadenosine phosphorylase
MTHWHIGVIGGSGLSEGLALDEGQTIAVSSAFGEPSGPVTMGTLAGVRFTFIARHGAGHRHSASQVDYRANIDVLKRCGVSDVVALSAIGSLREGLAPGHFVAVDQIIDRTVGRAATFFDAGVAAHVGLAEPICPRLAGYAADAAERAGATVHRGGCYVAIEGPRFSTRAESALYRQWGADVIGMTAMPEAALAREAELPYAVLGMVTDYDSWREGEAPVEASAILEVMRANGAAARAALRHLAEALPARRAESPIDRALDTAVVTPVGQWSAPAKARLGAVAGRYLRAAAD